MSRRCDITEKGPLSGNNVSHSQRKSRRTFKVNVQNTSVYSDALKRMVRLKLAASTIRTIDHNGGLDAYLLSTSNSKLSAEAQALKKQIKKAREQQAA